MFDEGIDLERTFGRINNMTRTRVRRRRAILAAGLAIAGIVWAGPLTAASAGSVARPEETRVYVVRDGDTIWEIAVRLGAGGDPRPLVDAISEANHVDASALRPGQTILVPSV